MNWQQIGTVPLRLLRAALALFDSACARRPNSRARRSYPASISCFLFEPLPLSFESRQEIFRQRRVKVSGDRHLTRKSSKFPLGACGRYWDKPRNRNTPICDGDLFTSGDSAEEA